MPKCQEWNSNNCTERFDLDKIKKLRYTVRIHKYGEKDGIV